MFGLGWMEIWIIAGLAVMAILLLMSMLARLYRKAGPHEALVVYGFRGTRVVKGHGTIIFPMIENCRDLSLELMSFDVAPQQDLYTKQGVAVTVEAVAQIKVKSDTESRARHCRCARHSRAGDPEAAQAGFADGTSGRDRTGPFLPAPRGR